MTIGMTAVQSLGFNSFWMLCVVFFMERRPLEKLVWLATYIYLHPGMSANEILNAYEREPLHLLGERLSYSTFNRLKEEIPRLMNGYKLIYKKSTDGYYIEETGHGTKDTLAIWIIKMMATRISISELLPCTERIIFDTQEQGINNLNLVAHATAKSWVLSFDYTKFRRFNGSHKVVEPLCINHHEGRWYLLARDRDKNQMRVYGCDRMTNIVVTNQRFKYPRGFYGADYFANYFGVYWPDGIEVEKVVIRANEFAANYLRTKPLHHSQVERRRGEDLFFEYIIAPTPDFRHALLRHEENIEIMEPAWFRKDFAEHIRRMLSLY